MRVLCFMLSCALLRHSTGTENKLRCHAATSPVGESSTANSNAGQAAHADNTQTGVLQVLAETQYLSPWGVKLEHHLALHQGLDRVDADTDLRQVRP